MGKRKRLPDDMGANEAERVPTRAAAQEEPSRAEAAARSKALLRKVSVFRLRPHDLQPHERHADSNVRDLMESIRKIGLQEPPLVRRLPDGSYQILAGHRRSRAWQLLALDGLADEKIRAFVLSELSDREAIYIMAAEYAHRRDFTPLHAAAVVGAAANERRDELGREPTNRELVDILPWERSSIAAYRKVSEALWDPHLGPLVQRLDRPDISLLYKVLCLSDFSRVVEVLDEYAEKGAAGARALLRPGRTTGRPRKIVTRQKQGDGYDLTVRFRSTMTDEDVRKALAEVERLRRDLEAALESAGAA